MEDKIIMNNILSVTKGACDLMMHGAIESSTQNVHGVFVQAFNDTLCMQNEIYAKMAQKGWYPAQQAEQQQISAVKTKFANKM